MSFVSMVDKIYPVEKMPRWIITLYKVWMSCYKKTFVKWQQERNNKKAGHYKRRSWYDRLVWKNKNRKAFSKYSIITPAYNMEKYLDCYFESLVSQSLNFEENIQVIIVDDGSTDRTAEIAKRWEAKYPKNILYLYQKNQKINIARNAGLSHVKHPWVAWIDADDFVHPDYFWHVDTLLQKYEQYKIKLLSCKQIVYYEGKNEFKDNRPFRYCFKHDAELRPCSNLGEYLHFTVNSAFFSMEEIRAQGITFARDNGWCAFDDAHFVLRYLKDVTEGCVLFSKNPNYYYRKRGDKTSNLDISWKRKQFFIDVIQDADLDILHQYKQKIGSVPVFVQRSILYDISWKIKGIANNPRSAAILSKDETEYFLNLCDRVFSYIDTATIDNFEYNLSQFGYFHKVGTRYCFKREPIECLFASCVKLDVHKQQICIRFYGSSPSQEAALFADGIALTPEYSKTTRRKFLTRTFIYEFYLWFKLPAAASEIRFQIDDRLVPIELDGEKHDSLSALQILSYFLRHYKNYAPVNAHWMLVDRDIQADDNAEHLYRYIAAAHPEQKIYFALRKSSHDWSRLEKEGFNLVEFGTARYLRLLRGASKLISSHLDFFIVEYKKDIMLGKQFVFLQHGITKDDMSGWFNTKHIDLLVTATKEEYDSIAKDESPYLLGPKEVVLSGFPRHDKLLALAQTVATQKSILVMPTWRNYLVGETKGKTHERFPVDNFFETEYAQHWLGLLRSDKLRTLAGDYGYNICFFPHFGMQSYFHTLGLPEHIRIMDHSQSGIQQLFVESAMMITDYSSVAFEMAYLQKAVLYYQFDEADFFSGKHVYTKDYFDYRRDGFGPVVNSVEELFSELEKMLAVQCVAHAPYAERIRNAFTNRDGNNCARVYEAIVKMDQPL